MLIEAVKAALYFRYDAVGWEIDELFEHLGDEHLLDGSFRG